MYALTVHLSVAPSATVLQAAYDHALTVPERVGPTPPADRIAQRAAESDREIERQPASEFAGHGSEAFKITKIPRRWAIPLARLN